MKTLQIRNVPDDVHRRLKVRAAGEGRTMSDLALAEIVKSLERPSRREWLDTLRSRVPVDLDGVDVAEIIREDRASH